MKLIIFFIPAIFSCILSVAQKPTDTISSKVIKPVLTDIVNGKKIKPVEGKIKFEKKEGNVLLIEIGDKSLTSKITEPVINNPQTGDETKGLLDKAKAIITFNVDDYYSIEDTDSLYVKLKVNKKSSQLVAILRKKKNTASEASETESGEPGINYLQLAQKLELSLGLADLYPMPESCCSDIDNPCDTKEPKVYNKNKIIYYADRNETVYYNNRGVRKVIDYEDIVIRAGRPLSFEIRNVNPDAFKVEISDTAIAYEVHVDSLLYFLPGVSEDGMALHAGGKSPNYNKKDTARAVLLVVYLNLKEFFLHLQNGCIYEFNANIARKIEAKKRIDAFLQKNLGTDGSIGLAQHLINNLDTASSKEDKELYENLLKLYNNLPSSYYRMITQIPSVPKDKDKIQFKFNIQARENKPYMSLVKEKTIDAYIVKNFRVDVSSGLYYAFNLLDNKYIVRADSIVGRNAANTADSTLKTGNSIIREDIGNGEFGFASFIHFYRRHSPSFSWGGHVGAGVSLNDRIRPRYFGGLSFIFGRDNTRFVVNAGIVAGNVSRISDQYQKNTDGSFKWIPTTETSVTTKTKFTAQPFLSISYNLPFRSKAKSTETVTPPGDKKTDPKKEEQKKEDKPKENTGVEQQSSKPKKETTKKTFYRN